MLKPSIYNYQTEGKNGGLILFNVLQGTKSLISISQENRSYVQNLLKSNEIENNCEKIELLNKKGFLVPIEQDEKVKLKSIYLDTVSRNDLILILLPTEKCNFRCKYCYESFSKGKMKAEVQDGIIEFIRKNIHKYNSLYISWFGGEPLIAYDVVERLSKEIQVICKSNRKKYIASMTTNGYLLTAEMVKRLYKMGVTHFQVTIDGLKETHDNQRVLLNGGETFETIINNLCNVKNNASSRMLRFVIRTNVTKKIAENIEQYIDYFHEKFSDDPRFSFAIQPAMDWGGDTINDFRENLINEIEMFNVFEKFYESDKKFRFAVKEYLEPGSGVCYAGKQNSFAIDANGNIHKCTCYFDDMDMNMVGRIKHDGVIDFDEYKNSLWICDNNYCKENCVFEPNCFRDNCPANRIMDVNKRNKVIGCASHGKNNLDKVLKLLENSVDGIELVF